MLAHHSAEKNAVSASVTLSAHCLGGGGAAVASAARAGQPQLQDFDDKLSPALGFQVRSADDPKSLSHRSPPHFFEAHLGTACALKHRCALAPRSSTLPGR